MTYIKKLGCKILLLAFVLAMVLEPLGAANALEKDGYATDDYGSLGFSYDNLQLHPSDGSIQSMGPIYWSCSGKLYNSGTAAYVSSWISNGFLTFQGLRLELHQVEQVYNQETGQNENQSKLVYTFFNNSYNDIRVVRFSESGSITLNPGEYTFVLKATFSGRTATICSHRLTVVNARPDANPTAKPTAKPNNTAKPNSSTSNTQSSSSSATKTWSSWSSWSTTPVTASSTRQVETKEETKTTTETTYKYSRWKYYNTAYKATYYSYAEYTGSSYKKGSGKWEYKTTTTPLSKTKVIDGRQQYSGYWYNQKTSTKEVNTTVTYYRYRDLITK